MIVKNNENLSLHTTFRVGGPAKIYYIPENQEELISLLRRFYEEKQPFQIIGNGSNLLVSDEGVDFAVIEIRGNLDDAMILEDHRIKVLAGTQLAKAANFALKQGLSGMEALHGIPGTVGGALVMNAGAYGTEISDVLESCEVITKEGKLETLPASMLDLSYRHSCIEEKGYTVLSASFKLTPGNPEEILAKMQDYKQRRSDKQPLNYPSAGSTFKRPEGNFAGKLIEEAGLRGFSIGDAQVSEKHCGFVINRGNATAREIYELIQEITKRVEKNSTIRLKTEVKMWGNF